MTAAINGVKRVMAPVVFSVMRQGFQRKEMPSFGISEIQRNLFREGALAIKHSPYTDYPTVLETTKELFQNTMQKDLGSYLKGMALQQTAPFFLLKNCPGNPFPGNTPEVDKHSVEKGFVEEHFMFGLAGNLFLKPYCDPFEKSGEVIAQILAMKGFENHKSSRGAGDLAYHAEHIHTDHAVHYIILSCVKGDRGAITKVLTVDECVEGLPKWVLDELMKPNFEMVSGDSFTHTGVWKGMKVKKIGAVLTPDPLGGFYIQYHGNTKERLIAKTEKGGEALDYFSKKIEQTEALEICLERCDTLILNGRKTIHAKKGGGTELSWEDRRWLLRLYAQMDYKAHFHEWARTHLISYPRELRV